MKSKAKHILYFSVILTVVALLQSPAIVSGQELSAEDLNMYEAPMKKVSPDVVDIPRTFQKPAPDQNQYQEFNRKHKDLVDIYEKYYGKIDAPAPPEEKKEAVCDKPLQVDYFFSFSMPTPSIIAAVGDALALRKQCVTVNMYLRGLVDDNLKKTIRMFYGIAKIHPEDLPIEVDPKRFHKENIETAPTVLVNGKRFVGDMRLAGIIKNLDTIHEGKVAVDYSIKEEDASTLFQRKGPLLEQKMREYVNSGKIYNKFKLTRYDGQFAHAKKRNVYYLDMTYTLPEDILDHNGQVIFRKGHTVNPLDMVSITKYIFIDGNRPEEVAFALAGNYRSIILMSGDAYELAKKHKKQFYHADDSLVQAFKIEKVPLIIEQEGRLIRATEQPI